MNNEELKAIDKRIREIKTELDILKSLNKSDEELKEIKVLMFDNLLNTIE